MKPRALPLLVGALLLLGGAPASASHGELYREDLELFAPVPCPGCAYLLSETYCEPDPTAPPLSWAERRFDLPIVVDGVQADVMQIRLEPLGDADLAVCIVQNPGETDETWTQSVNTVPACPELLGCTEIQSVALPPSGRVVIRAFNLLEGPTVRGEYRLFHLRA